jgi:hypothetical protein
MRRNHKQHFTNTGEKKILQLIIERGIEKSSYISILIRGLRKEKGRNPREQVQRSALCIALLFN